MSEISGKTGITFEPYTFVIERGKIKEFANALGDDNPIYFSKEAALESGFTDIPIPPTFPTAIDMWAGPNFDRLIEDLELNPLKVLHGEQEYQYLQDIVAGDEIKGHSKVIAAVAKKKMNVITIETQYFNQREECVLISRLTIVERI
jgi:acyl dehydratase